MFELIEDFNEATDKALQFLIAEAPGVNISAERIRHLLPFNDKVGHNHTTGNYPCLIDFYVTYYLDRNRTLLPSLAYVFCDKKIAKFLVYHKTNKVINSRHHWRLIEGGATLESFKEIQRWHGKHIIESTGFRPTLLECLRNEEPFLFHSVIMSDSHGDNQRHHSIVTLELAKALVYHKKNLSLMNRLSTDDLLKLLNNFREKNPEIKSMWDSNVISEIRKKILESKKNEIPF